ncbi:MAG TPA: PadR family transcriptional regulator [Chitinophagales bacterium]|nr:PadR family transcriptional regulator [Chitinophagales bacterium]HMU70143.1 PadR family transcriptional regulator [Chitinophagales bacterium]HMX03586.1 PadR family transcriptional regulator [Chitinophagales bacterium]HMZ89497.1 PadR family transcriptional regulator [Chitinophagales bacterium]HNA57103.1 PadR family transcriptional regulator [Chitinophagales bacterium]
MNIENAQAQMRKGVLEFCILAIISEGEIYPTDVISRLKESNLLVAEGTVYPLLNRLKTMELLSYKWVESNSGPPRKYYQLTDTGRKFLSELDKTWQELVHAVSINTKNIKLTQQ